MMQLVVLVTTIIGLAGCGGGGATDTTAPTVTATTPANNATNVSVSAPLTATFSEALSASAVSAASFTLSDGANNATGTISYSGMTATFTPDPNLAFSTTYTATITASVKDAAGNTMSGDYSWTFTTSAIPDIDSNFACARVLDPVSSGTCAVSPGMGSATLIQGNVVQPQGLQSAGEVLIDNGTIMCSGCDCSSVVGASTATVLRCPEAVISPGLINAAVHATFGRNAPFGNTERFEQRHDWLVGARGHTQLTVVSDSTGGPIWEEIREVIAGTTSGVTYGAAQGLMRNLDDTVSSGFTHATTSTILFPLGDSNGVQLTSSCGYPSIVPWASIQNNTATLLDVAQGIDAAALNESYCLSGIGDGSENILLNPTVIVGGSGLTLGDINLTASRGTGLVWTPRSDTSLYGNTAPLPIYKRTGMPIALGTYWPASGSANMLRELSCAGQWNRAWGDSVFTDRELVNLATSNAAALSGYGDVLGTLEPGMAADIVIWDAAVNVGYQAILQATNKDVVLVLRGGTPLYGDEALIGTLAAADNCEILDVCGRTKRLCAQRELGTSLADVMATALGVYPLFACGSWANEPTCIPSRNSPDAYTGIPTASDSDGDGVADTSDNCPDMFNSPTPLSAGLQADSDNDGTGDVCDMNDSTVTVGP